MKTILKLNNLKNTLLAIFISVGLVATSDAATFDSEQMAQIESIIDEYVSNHPEVILRAMKKLEMDEKSIEEYQRYHSFVLTDSEWEERRYEIAKEIYLNKFSDFSKESAELALMAADDFIGVLKKHYQNKD